MNDLMMVLVDGFTLCSKTKKSSTRSKHYNFSQSRPLAGAVKCQTRVVLAGDHMQLSPETFSPFALQRNLNKSLGSVRQSNSAHYPVDSPVPTHHWYIFAALISFDMVKVKGLRFFFGV